MNKQHIESLSAMIEQVAKRKHSLEDLNALVETLTPEFNRVSDQEREKALAEIAQNLLKVWEVPVMVPSGKALHEITGVLTLGANFEVEEAREISCALAPLFPGLPSPLTMRPGKVGKVKAKVA